MAKWLAGFLLIQQLFVMSVQANTEVRHREGIARDADTGQLLYKEMHREYFREGRIFRSNVRYVDASGEPFAYKTVDFTKPALPAFRLENQRTGHLESGKPTEKGYRITFRESFDAPKEEQWLVLAANAVADAGIDRVVEQQWPELNTGQTPVFPLIIPSALDTYDFRVTVADIDEMPGEEKDPEWFVLRMEPESFFLRLAAPATYIAYDAKTRALRRYAGVSNLRDHEGKNYKVIIDFAVKPEG